MAHQQRTHTHFTVANRAAAARVQAALSAATAEQVGATRQRFVWSFLASLSALALSVYHPGVPADVRAEDWKPTPREPEQDRDPFGTKTNQRTGWRPNGKSDLHRHPAPRIRLVANEEPQGGSKQRFDIPAGELEGALIEFSRHTGVQSLYPSELVAGRRTQGVQGDYTPEGALQGILTGTGLWFLFSNPGTVTLQQADQPGAVRPDAPSAGLADEPKPIKIKEIVVKEVRERPSWTTPVDGYKADTSSSVTRSNMAIEEIPTSIGVVTRDIIKDTLSRTQGDAFEAVSGVSRSSATMSRSEAIDIRGFNACNFNGSFNGMKVNGLPTDCLFAPDWGIVERYEVIKGPASIIGGAATPGGVINRITKTPQRLNFAKVESNIGSYGLYRGLIDANGVLPINDNVRGRLVFAVEEGGNFVDFTPVRQYTVHPSVEFDLFKGAGKLLLVGTYQTFKGASYPGWPLTSDGKMLNVPRTRNVGGGANAGAHTNFKGYEGEAHYDHQFIHGIKLTAKGKYQKSKLTDNSIYPYTYPYNSGISPSGDTYLSNAFRKIRFETYAGELFLSKEFNLLGQKHEILAGADYRDMTQNLLTAFPFLPVDGPPFFIDNVFNPRNSIPVLSDAVLTSLGLPRVITNLKQTGVFGQTVIRPFERLTLVLAGRHDNADVSTTDSPGRTDSALTGRAGATVKVTPWMNVYGGVQQSFAPQPFALNRTGVLEPETGINYELGAKLNLFEDRLLLTTALFRTYRRNVATLDPTDPRFSVAVGEQRHQGVEFDVNGQPIPGLKLNANFFYLDAVITEDNDPVFVGAYPTQVPRNYTGRVFANYQLQSGPLQGFGFGGGVYFQGGYELTFPNAIKTDAYERVDALLFYRGNERYDLSVNIRNVLNAKYIEIPRFIDFGNGFGAPITAIASLRIFF
ncbi:MAG: TonB-dependent receptor [Nitrospira sp.]|nr:TonB-dependent receptor [Nitrospira sp.]